MHSVNQRRHIFRWSELRYAVTEIENMTVAVTEAGQHPGRFTLDNVGRGQQNRRGCIAAAGLTNQLAARFEAKAFNVLDRFMEVLLAAYHLNMGGVEHWRQAFNRALKQ